MFKALSLAAVLAAGTAQAGYRGCGSKGLACCWRSDPYEYYCYDGSECTGTPGRRICKSQVEVYEAPDDACGNKKIDSDGECEPPGRPGCSDTCKPEPCPPQEPCPDPPAQSCGNDIVEEGEDCEPPNTGTCDGSCKYPEPRCGDNIVQMNERCEPPGEGGCDDNCQFAPPPPGPPAQPCARCKDKNSGKISQVTLQWTCPGATPASIDLKKGGRYDAATGIATFGTPGEKLGGDLELPNDEQLHLSCSAPFGIGITTYTDDKDDQVCNGGGCWTVIDAKSTTGATYCDLCDGTPPTGTPPGTPCLGCKDKGAGKPVSVTLEWKCEGDPPAAVTLGGKKKKSKGGNMQYDSSTGIVVFSATDKKLGSQLDFQAAGRTESLHTSCSAPFGIGVRTFTDGQEKSDQGGCDGGAGGQGCFEVIGAINENGGSYCELNCADFD